MAAETRAPEAYVTDIGLFDEALNAEVRERLVALHGETGREIHIVTMLTTDERPIGEVAAEMIGERNIGESGALILIALADEQLILQPAPGAEAFDASLRQAVERALIDGLDGNDVPSGMAAALDLLDEGLAG